MGAQSQSTTDLFHTGCASPPPLSLLEREITPTGLTSQRNRRRRYVGKPILLFLRGAIALGHADLENELQPPKRPP